MTGLAASTLVGFALVAGAAVPPVGAGASGGADVPTGAVGSNDASMSPDGRFVAFGTDAALDPADINGVSDVYLRDVRRGTVRLVGTDADPASVFVQAGLPRLSRNGRYLAYSSYHLNLETNSGQVIQVRNLRTGGAAALDGGRLDHQARALWISDDGRHVLTYSTSEGHEFEGMLVRSDRATGTRTDITPDRDTDGQWPGTPIEAVASQDGRTVAFIGKDWGALGPSNRAYVLTADGSTRRVPAADPALLWATTPVLSGNGRVLAFLATRQDGSRAVVLADTAGGPARTTEFGDDSAPVALSRDGRILVLLRQVRSQGSVRQEVVVRTGTGSRVAYATAAGFRVGGIQLSADGCHLLFGTDQPLTSMDRNHLADIYLLDLRTGDTQLMSAG